MKQSLVLLIGLLMVGVGTLLSLLTFLSFLSQTKMPTFVAILVLFFSGAMATLGIVGLLRFAYETTLKENDLEMQFVLRKERVNYQDIESCDKLFFRNRVFCSAAVLIKLKYKVFRNHKVSHKCALVVLPGLGPALGAKIQDLETPLDTLLSRKKEQSEAIWRPSEKTWWANQLRANFSAPATKDILQIVVEHASPSLQEELRLFERPLKLLTT